MGALLGLVLGLGLLLVWSSTWPPQATPRRTSDATSRLRSLLAGAGLPDVTVAGFLTVCAVSGALAATVVLLASRTPPVALVFGLMGAYLPVALLRGRAERRLRELAEVWPEAVDNLASAVRAGMPLPEALAGLAERGPEPLRPHFRAFATDYQAGGRFADALERLKERLADPVGDRVVESLRVAREVGGGDLGRLLRTLSGYLRDDARTRAELQSRQAWTVNGARLAVAAPWLVLLMLCFQPEVISRYASPTGVVVLGVGAALCAAAYRLMVRIGRLPTERRILS